MPYNSQVYVKYGEMRNELGKAVTYLLLASMKLLNQAEN